MPKMTTHIAVLNSHPIQYFSPLYAFLNREPDLDITALYLSNISLRGGRDRGFGKDISWDIDLLSGYRSLFIGSAAEKRVPNGFFSLIAPQLINEIRSGKYDVLWLNGHNYAANHIAILAAKSVGVPILMRSETHLGLQRGGVKALLRRPLMQRFYNLCDGFLAIGSANRNFYRAMGVAPEDIYLVPYSVDNQRFMAGARLGREERHSVRQQLGIPPEPHPAILFASKFQHRKHPDDLVRAVDKLAHLNVPCSLVMVGAGDMEQSLKALVTQLGVRDVVFPGFVNQSELPRMYAACDVFVLPSENEPWGLVVNEVMCAGLPVVASDEIGCVPDLVSHGENGFTFTAGDVDGLVAALRPLLEDRSLRQRMSDASLKRISGWGYEQCLEGIRAAVSHVRSDAS